MQKYIDLENHNAYATYPITEQHIYILQTLYKISDILFLNIIFSKLNMQLKIKINIMRHKLSLISINSTSFTFYLALFSSLYFNYLKLLFLSSNFEFIIS